MPRGMGSLPSWDVTVVFGKNTPFHYLLVPGDILGL